MNLKDLIHRRIPLRLWHRDLLRKLARRMGERASGAGILAKILDADLRAIRDPDTPGSERRPLRESPPLPRGEEREGVIRAYPVATPTY
jgi:hypothetical protein